MHRRRRTALSVTVAFLVAAPLLSACSEDAHPGAAAVVGGQRIEVSTLQAQVRDVRDAQQASPQSAELIKNTGRLNQAKLYGMILDRVLQRAADDAGVKVSRKEVQATRQQAAAQYGGEKQFTTMLLQQSAFAPGQVDTVVRRQVLLNKLGASLGVSPGDDQALLASLSETSKKLHIDVNPRYGTWDNKKIELGEYKAPWITQVTAEAPQQEPAGA